MRIGGILVLSLLALPRPAVEAQSSGVTWKTDPRQAFDEARRTNKPLWVLFR
jgi:hypothetical protein